MGSIALDSYFYMYVYVLSFFCNLVLHVIGGALILSGEIIKLV